MGISADGKLLTIEFEGKIDTEQFVFNLTSLALAPLRENIASKGDDWAKKPGTMVCSGPFKLARVGFSTDESTRYEDINYDVKTPISKDKTIYTRATESQKFRAQVANSFILERNSYYYRNSEKDEYLDVSVKPYRIIVDCSMSDEDIAEAYEQGTIVYVGDIPMSLRNTYKDQAIIKESLSTNVCYFNQNAEIGGKKLFAIKEVRQALSMVIDREALANEIVFAKAATGLVPTGVFDTNSKGTLFRDKSDNNFKYLTKDIEGAKALLKNAGINPADYSFKLTVAAYDEVHNFIANAIVEAWNALGFNVELNVRGTIKNNDYYKYTDSVPEDICDDLYAEDFRNGVYEAILIDMVAISADPFAVLAPFAKQFSGQAMDMSVPGSYVLTPHATGYDSAEYNELLEKIFTEKTISNRSDDYHAAEAILMEDLPVVPIVFNESATLIGGVELNNKFLFWKKSTNYYGAETLKEVEIKSYDDYLVTCTEFLQSKFDTYKTNPLSYFGSESFSVLTWDEFKEESSNYAYLFQKEKEAKAESEKKAKESIEAAKKEATENSGN
jgi:ABC-type oligopeptide transport system substrate-binding subunit